MGLAEQNSFCGGVHREFVIAIRPRTGLGQMLTAAPTSVARTPSADDCMSGRAAARRTVAGGRCLRESRSPALYVLLLLCSGRCQIVAQLVFSLIHSATPQQDLSQEQSRIRKLAFRLTQHFHGFNRVAFLRG